VRLEGEHKTGSSTRNVVWGGGGGLTVQGLVYNPVDCPSIYSLPQ